MTIADFATRVYEDRKIAFSKRGIGALDFECATRVVPKVKYTRVDVGPRSNWSGRFMIDAEGKIYGIKAYGKVNKRKVYGTLETVDEWFWGEYYPIKRRKL